MSTKEQKYWSLVDAKILIEELSTSRRKRNWVLKDMRERAEKILKHWPNRGDIVGERY